MSLLVVGSVALDTIETPFDKREEILGGSASYFATVASLLIPARIVAIVGEDFPQEHLDFLAGRGTDLTGVTRQAGKTFRWSGRYLDNMVDRETLDTQLNVFESFDPQLPSSYRDSRYVFLANIQPQLQLRVLDQIAAPEIVACDTMNFWINERHIEALRQVISRSQIAIVNDEEARLLSGESNLIRAAEAVRERTGVRCVIVKRGDAGAMLFDEQGVFWAPALPLRSVVDPTGAGDSFAGGLMAYLCLTNDTSVANVRKAMIVGSATASFTVEGFAVERYRDLTRGDLMARCAEISGLVRHGSIEF